MADTSGDLMPPQIILFLENIWEFAEGDEKIYEEEIWTTFLHEAGHFLGKMKKVYGNEGYNSLWIKGFMRVWVLQNFFKKNLARF